MAKFYKTTDHDPETGLKLEEVTEVTPKNGKTFVYEELTAFVDGMVQIVPMPSGKQMVINEEGKLIGLPKNIKATEVWMKEYPIAEYPDNNDELIVGNALVCEESELE